MARHKEVRITYGDEEAVVMEQSVARWEKNGWTRVDDGDSESGENPGSDESEQDPEQVEDEPAEPELTDEQIALTEGEDVVERKDQ